MIKHILSFLATAFLCLPAVIPAFDANAADTSADASDSFVLADTAYSDYTGPGFYKTDRFFFYDESGIFTMADKIRIEHLFEDTASKIGFSLVLYTAGADRSDDSIESFADNGAKEIFGDTPEGVVFLYVDLDGYSDAYDYMYAERFASLYYTGTFFGERTVEIVKAMQKKFPAGGAAIDPEDIIAGLEVYCSKLIEYKQLGPEENSYFYHKDTGMYSVVSGGRIIDSKFHPYGEWWFFALMGLTLTGMTCLPIIATVKKTYKFKSTTSASVYTGGNKIFWKNQQDIFINSVVTKTYIPPSSSSSGGGGGGHGGGGHSSGGGGGSHR